MSSRPTTSNTPQRQSRRHNNFKENINFFEPGKQGRRTGLVLKDSGVRDEHGFEPVSGIFSSPVASPQRSPQRVPANGNDTALGSSEMVLQDSSIPEIAETLNLRKTPHLPPKTQTPRHTNIGGSPVRHSAIKPVDTQSSPQHASSAPSTDRTSRRLDFANKQQNNKAQPAVVPSPSPFKPRFGKSRKSVFDLQNSPTTLQHHQDDDDIDNSVQQVQDAVNDLFDDDVPQHVLSSARSTRSQKRKLANPSSPIVMQPPSVPKSNKRPRPSLEHQKDQTVMDHTLADQTMADQPTVDQTAADYTVADQTTMDQTELPDQTDAEYTYITVDQTEMPDQTELPDQTEMHDETEAPDQTEMMDQTEAPEETGVEYTWVDQTVLDHTTVDQTMAEEAGIEQTMADETTVDQTERTHVYDHTIGNATIAEDDIAETTELHDEPIMEASAPFSTKKKRPFEVRKDAGEQPHENNAKHHDQDLDDSSPSNAAQDFVPPPEDDLQDESDHEAQTQPEPTKKRGRAKAPAKAKGKKKQPSASVEPRPRASRDSESVGPDGLRKPGPKSIVNLRAGTPADDEGAKTTRSGRTSIKPLKYWCNETYIWNQGEVEGVVRAEPVEQTNPKRAAPSRKKATRLGPIKEDEEEDEDLLPEAWEQELGVINSSVRAWDARTGTGSTKADGVSEGKTFLVYFHGYITTDINLIDIAFAATAIKTQDVHGSSFRYAKVMTLPFFGSGMVEIPPDGYKRMKNSRKMQMVFFVHEGKVTVDIEDVQFGMTKGGVWQVPRGKFLLSFTSLLLFLFSLIW
ncbi:hypothetical protein E4T43_02988 [Aureobasidium subglaciale]|nr:hypothetical protein E4T43_02988 [Aureobasidium subglaciale]